MNYKVFLILILSLSNTIAGYSRSHYIKGYIVINRGDTVHGFIKDRRETPNARMVKFKKSLDSKAIIYTPNDIIAYYISNGKSYFSRKITKEYKIFFLKNVFLKQLAKGKVNLYYYKNEKGSIRFFIEKDSTGLKELYDNPLEKSFNRATLDFLLTNCPDININRIKGRLKSWRLIELIDKYNKCFAPGTSSTISRKEAKIKKTIGLSIGPNFSNFLNSEGTFKTNINYKTNLIRDIKVGNAAGLNLEYHFKNNLSLKFTLLYESKGINLNYKIKRADSFNISRWIDNNNYPNYIPPTPSSNIIYYEATYIRKINNTYLTLPIILKKNFSGKMKLFVGGGLYLSYLIRSKIYSMDKEKEYIENYSFFGNSNKIEKSIDKGRPYTMPFDFGGIIGTGFSYPLTTKISCSSEILGSMGIIKVDKKNNNEYKKVYSNYWPSEAKNYLGLNSLSKNINLSLQFGLSYKLGR